MVVTHTNKGDLMEKIGQYLLIKNILIIFVA